MNPLVGTLARPAGCFKMSVIAAALLLSPVLAQAHSYNYLEGGYVHRDQRGDEDGLRMAGSFDVASPVAVFAEYATVEDFDQLSVGGLFHTPINDELDLNLGASLEDVNYSDGGGDTGFGLRAGVRWLLPQTPVEMNPELRFVKVDHRELTSLRVAGLYQLGTAVDLETALQAGDDDRLELGVRYNFGPRLTGR